VHDSDLPVQSFARHLTDELSAERIRPIIAGMRGFLEGKPELIPTGIDLVDAEDGYQAVEILATAAGLGQSQIAAARRASRSDLAASAWAVDQTNGLDDLLDLLANQAVIALLTEPGDPAAGPVLHSIGLPGRFDELIDASALAGVPQVLERIGAAANPERLLMVGTRWTADLAHAHDAGSGTAMIDRYGRARGTPTFRSPDLPGLLPGIRGWLGATAPTDATTGEVEDRDGHQV